MIKDFPWKAVIILAVIYLVRPLLSIMGLFDSLGPAGPVIVSGVIGAIWVGYTVFFRLNFPVLVLTLAGAVYAVLSILLTAIVRVYFPAASGDAPAALSLVLTAGFAGTLLTSVIWGAFLGLVAKLVMGLNRGT